MILASDVLRYKDEILKEKRYPSDVQYPNPNFYGSIDMNNRNRPTKSIFSKRMDEIANEVVRFTKEIDKQIKDSGDRVRKLSATPNGVKYEIEIRNQIASLYSHKLAAIKTKADLATKIDKANKEDIKLSMDLNGGKGVDSDFANSISSTNSFITSFINNGGKDTPTYNFSTTNVTPSSLEPIRPTVTPAVIEHQSDTANSIYNKSLSPVTVNKEPVQIPVQEVPQMAEEVIYNDEPVYVPEDDEEESAIVDNIDDIQVDDTGVNNFIGNGGADDLGIDYARSLANLEAYSNPNIKQYFKYNKEEGIGYVVAVDEETKKEVPGIMEIPMELTYPWSIDNINRVATIMIQEDYPVLYTSDPIPEDIKNDFKLIYERESRKKDEYTPTP